MQKGEMTRQRIVEEAAPIFNQRGFAGCSIQQVMEATGLEKGGLYRHFSSKEELAAEAFRYALETVLRARLKGLDEAENAVDQLRSVVRRFVEVPSPMPGGCPLMNTAIDADDGNPVLRGLARTGVKEWRARLCGVVEEGIELGEIRAGTEPRQVANVIIATLEGALMMSRLEGDRTAMRDARAMLDRMLDEVSVSR